MSTYLRRIFRHVRSLLVCVALITASACTDTIHDWTEIVELPGGEIVHVRQYVDLGDSRMSIGGPADPRVSRREFQVVGPPEVVTTTFKDLRRPMLLTRDPGTKEFLIVATTGSTDVWMAHGRPPYPFWMFRYRDGKWMEEPVADYLFGVKTNLSLASDYADKVEGVVTLEMKRKWSVESNADRRFRKVERNYRPQDL